jgi:hypothetical protein
VSKKPYKHDEEALSKMVSQINYELSTPPSVARDVCSYTTKHAYGVIKKELEDVHGRGYEFDFDENQKAFFSHVKNIDDWYEIKRVLKLRFKCKNNRCSEFVRSRKGNSQRKWTTYYGMVIFSFCFEKKKRG